MLLREPVRIVLLAFLLLLAGCDQVDGELMMPDGAVVPHRFSEHRGDRVYINYWAEWCTPCRAEIPELNALGAEAGHTVLGRNFDGLEGEELAQLLAKMGIEFAVLLEDPAQRFAQNVPSVLPTTFVLDAQGTLLEVLVGPQTVDSLKEAGAGAS